MSLAAYAGVEVGLSEELPLGLVLEHEGVDATRWPEAAERWSERLLDDDAGTLEAAFDAAMAEARGRYGRPIAPLDDEVRPWLDFVRAFGAAPEPLAFLAEHHLSANDLLRLNQRWSARLAADEGLAHEAHAILAEPPRPLPPITVKARAPGLDATAVAAHLAAPPVEAAPEPERVLFAPIAGAPSPPLGTPQPLAPSPTAPRPTSSWPSATPFAAPVVAPLPGPLCSPPPVPPPAPAVGEAMLLSTVSGEVMSPLRPATPFERPSSKPPKPSEPPRAPAPEPAPEVPVAGGRVAAKTLIGARSPFAAGPATPFESKGGTAAPPGSAPAPLPAATPFEKRASSTPPGPPPAGPAATPFDKKRVSSAPPPGPTAAPAQPAARAQPAAPAAAPPPARLTLDEYASIEAELEAAGPEGAAVVRRYGFDRTSFAQERAAWAARLRADPALWRHYDERLRAFKQWLARRR